MRWINWRSILAVIALVVGLGAGAVTVPASADAGTSTTSQSTYFAPMDDHWW